MTDVSLKTHQLLVKSLLNDSLYETKPCHFDVIETHISSVILTGTDAYKIKKPLNLGFLDFSSLEQRRYFCQEELRLNRRLAADMYLDVVPIYGSHKAPSFEATGEPIEYAVHMKQFAQATLLPNIASRNELTLEHMNALAKQMADFHARARVANEDTAFGEPQALFFPVQENFDQLRPLVNEPDNIQILGQLETWSKTRFSDLQDALNNRKKNGFIRECHGDLHLGNMTLQDNKIVIFDGIEFNDLFRWIDVISDLAFTLMDLDERGLTAHANRLLNQYLDISGDYAALELVSFYKVYRALVRAKITAIRLSQNSVNSAEAVQLNQQLTRYIHLARHYTLDKSTHIVMTYGLSASGKSTFSKTLSDELGFIQIRSDVERKRLNQLSSLDKSHDTLNQGIYDGATTTLTYARLIKLAELIVRADYHVVIDATYLKAAQRSMVQALSNSTGLPYHIADIQCPLALSRQEIIARAERGDDASEATLEVLEQQIKERQPLDSHEQGHAIKVYIEKPLSADVLDAFIS